MDWLTDFLGWLEPAWVTACVAVVVGGYTIVNVRTARRAYVDATFDRKVGQARLVWGKVGLHIGKEAGVQVGDMGRRRLDAGPSTVIGGALDFYEARRENGLDVSVTTRDLTIFRVRITNNSTEPIGRCTVTLRGSRPLAFKDGAPVPREGPATWEHRPQEMAARVLAPGESVTVRVVVPVAITDVVSRKTHVIIGFTDSAGTRWSRTDTRAPKDATHPKPKPFPRLRGRARRW
jgi:hypothetical protein